MLKKKKVIFFILQDLLPSTQQQSVERKTEGGPLVNNESSCGTSVPEASTVSRKTDIIDDLLGGLSSDLEKIGVQTTAKGNCASCKKCIVGKVPLFPYMHLNGILFIFLPILFITMILGRWSQHWVRCGTLNTFCAWCVKRSWAAQVSLRGMGVHIVTKTTISSSPLVVPTARGPFCTWEKPFSVTLSFCYLPQGR